MKWWAAYAVLVVLSCLPGGSEPAQVDDPGSEDTGLVIRPRVAWDTVPRGCRLDSLGRMLCPDIRPERRP